MLSQAASNETRRARRVRESVSLTVAQALTSSLRRDLLPEALGNVQKDREKIKKRQDESFYPCCFFVWSFRSKRGISQSGRGNKVWKHNWWVWSQCVCVCVWCVCCTYSSTILYYNIIQPLANFTYILTFTCLEWFENHSFEKNDWKVLERRNNHLNIAYYIWN